MGDPSGDGHGQTETINIKSSLNKKEIEKAYKAGTKKLGFDFCKDVCAEYEDSELDSEKWETLKKLGYQDQDLENEVNEAKKYNNGDIYLWTDSFSNIYLFIVKLGNDNFKFEHLTEKENPTIDIGGYGLLGT